MAKTQVIDKTQDEEKDEPKTEIKKDTSSKKPQFVLYRHEELFIKANTFKKLHEALHEAEAAEETLTVIKYVMPCYPLDGIVAINAALEKVFGFTRALDRPGFFGPKPPLRLSIKTGVDEEVQVAAGRLNPPSWEQGYIDMHVMPDNPMALTVVGQVKRKFEPSITEVVELAKKMMKEDSIYRGQAVELDLRYIDALQAGAGWNPDTCSPVFVDVREDVQLILPRDIEAELKTEIWDVIRKPDDFRYNKIPIKYGALLSGPFGTGKTLTARKTAKISTEAGWSYFSLKTPDKFLWAYKMAQLYAPSVLFVEDVDAIFSGGRTEFMNEILETLDGVASKGNEVMTVFTTNFPEKINEAFMRKGRVDNEIKFRALDAEAAGRFIQTFASEFLAPDIDITAVGKAFDDMVASEITGGVQKAKKIAISEVGREIRGKISTEMLETAGEIVKNQKGHKTVIPQAEKNLRIIQAAAWASLGLEQPGDVRVDHPFHKYADGAKPARAKELSIDEQVERDV